MGHSRVWLVSALRFHGRNDSEVCWDPRLDDEPEAMPH